ncbi:MAG TPA: cytochrome C oxidase subunit I, partial [Prosthecobacter sp.]
MSAAAHTHDHSHGADHAHDHHEPGFIGKYIFSCDHKVIGVQYALSGLLFLLLGFFLMLLMRWSIAFPGQEVPGLLF